MGCITLEWIIWLVYGIDELKIFHQQACPDDFDAFWSRESNDHPIHPVVVSWMNHMTETCLVDGDQCYSIALRKLLIFARDRLLVPDLGELDPTDPTQQSIGGSKLPILLTPAPDSKSGNPFSGRAKCKESCAELEAISSIPDDIPNYMHNPKVLMSGRNARGPPTSTPLIPSKLKVPSPTSSSRHEVNGPHDDR